MAQEMIIKEDCVLIEETLVRLTETLRKIRPTSAKTLLQQHVKNGHRKILLTDEKSFTVEEKFNRQNYRKVDILNIIKNYFSY